LNVTFESAGLNNDILEHQPLTRSCSREPRLMTLAEIAAERERCPAAAGFGAVIVRLSMGDAP
jgi:hypothetical protein